jgi:hypothetical protein
MPKIRDLGINTIPITMRPPEIGPGGGIFACNQSHNDHASACGSPSCVGQGTSACGDLSCKPHDDDATSACGSPSCIVDETSGCESPSCIDDDETSGCESPSCAKSPKSPHDHHASAFSPAAIAQLKQQLELHIGQ